jgi:hypothetical protein
MEASGAVEARRESSEPPRTALPAFLPLVVLPWSARSRAGSFEAELRDVIRRYLPRVGAIVLRGFRLPEDRDFERFVAAAEPDAARGRLWAWCAVPVRSRCVELGELTGALAGFEGHAAPGWRLMHADGSPLHVREVDAMNAALEACRLLLSWKAGDVLLLDGSFSGRYGSPERAT